MPGNEARHQELGPPLGPAVTEGPAKLGRRLERTAEFTTWVAEFLRVYARGTVRSEAGFGETAAAESGR